MSESFQTIGLALELARLGITQQRYLTCGDVFYVDSGHANASDDTDHGTCWDLPFATIDYAVGRCTANNGDVIFVAAGHAETVNSAGALDLDTAGIRIIGIGWGDLRPTITVGAESTAGCDVDVDANDITIENVIFTITAVDVTAIIDVNAARFHIKDCLFNMQISSYEAVKALDIGGASDNDGDECVVENCEFRAHVEGGETNNATTHAIYVSKNADRLRIIDNAFLGSFEESVIEVKSGETATKSVVKGNWGYNTDATNGLFCKMDSSQILFFIDNKVATLVSNTEPVSDGSASYFVENYGTDTINTSAVVYPASATEWS